MIKIVFWVQWLIFAITYNKIYYPIRGPKGHWTNFHHLCLDDFFLTFILYYSILISYLYLSVIFRNIIHELGLYFWIYQWLIWLNFVFIKHNIMNKKFGRLTVIRLEHKIIHPGGNCWSLILLRENIFEKDREILCRWDNLCKRRVVYTSYFYILRARAYTDCFHCTLEKSTENFEVHGDEVGGGEKKR